MALDKEQLKRLLPELIGALTGDEVRKRMAEAAAGGNRLGVMQVAMEVQARVLARHGLDPRTGLRELAEAAKQRGEYLRSHALQALALETAEAAAEWLHARLRAQWGFPDSPEASID